MKHTTQEWRREGTLVYALEETGRYRWTPEVRNRFQAGVSGGPDTPKEEVEANARLMQSAPKLLRELEHLVRLLEPLENNGTLDVPGLATLNGARAAIKEAKGE